MSDPGKPIDPGSPGFPIDGQTYTYDVGVPDAQGGAQGPYTPGVDVSAGYTDANGAPKDLSAPTKTTLAQYLSNVTLGKEGSTPVSNRYPVDSTTKTASTTDNKGYPSQLESPPNNASTFTGGDEATTSYATAQYPTLAPLIKKGLASNNNVDGNDLLPGVPGNTTYVASPGNQAGDGSQNPKPIAGHADTSQKVIGPYVSKILANNRFAAAATNAKQNPYTTDIDEANPPASYDPTFAQQGKLGYHDPGASTLTAGQLAAVGPLLTMRAGLVPGSTNPGADPNSAGLQASALLPGLAQLGTSQVDNTLLTARDVLASLTTDEVPNNDVVSIGSKSWGQLNNTEDPFSGTDAIGMFALSVTLVASTIVIFDALSALLGLITPSLKLPVRDVEGRYTLGEFYPGSKAGTRAASQGGLFGAVSALGTLNLAAMLGIQPTYYPFSQALTTGLNAFFGVQGGAGIGLNQLAGAIQSSTDSPGFDVVLCRAIARSSAMIVNQLKGVGKGNPVSAINSVLSLVDTLRSSKLVAACNVFAQLGDAQLSMPSGWVDNDVTNAVKVSSMDQTPNELANGVNKNRLRTSLKLAWASNRSRANLLIPSQILGVNSSLSMDQFDPTAATGKLSAAGSDQLSYVDSTVTLPQNSGRIDPDTAAQFEQTLEAEYVPFYFHDLRTNEMLGFHAFLASLNDDYSAAYDKVDGFGRVEAVRIYKSTERRIGMSFYVVATSLPDFDEMWIKINKLVTMVYPQYTQGLSVQSQDKSFTFTQPFSQLVGASPLIRIRLGDLLRSNYSQFALARLFGLGNSDFTVNNEQFTDGASFDQSQLEILQQAVLNDLLAPQGNTYYVGAGKFPLFSSPGGGIGNAGAALGVSAGASALGVIAGSGPSAAAEFDTSLTTIPNLFVATAMQQDPDSLGVVCRIDINNDPVFAQAFGPAIAKARAKFQYGSPAETVVGNSYIMPLNALVPTPQTKRTLLQQNAPESTSAGFAQELADFIDPAKNAIAKSFKDVGGKGLAGFIETMSFDWYDKATWETTGLGRIAPKMCKVTLQFAPVHDITPGLDSFGYNIAPIYPVGVMGPQRPTFTSNK